MPNITLTEENPAITKAVGGGGSEFVGLTDTELVIAKAAGGGGRESAFLLDTEYEITKASGGGGTELVLLFNPPPALWDSRARAGFNPLFKLVIDGS